MKLALSNIQMRLANCHWHILTWSKIKWVTVKVATGQHPPPLLGPQLPLFKTDLSLHTLTHFTPICSVISTTYYSPGLEYCSAAFCTTIILVFFKSLDCSSPVKSFPFQLLLNYSELTSWGHQPAGRVSSSSDFVYACVLMWAFASAIQYYRNKS